jgi:hypothetical protein
VFMTLMLWMRVVVASIAITIAAKLAIKLGR